MATCTCYIIIYLFHFFVSDGEISGWGSGMGCGGGLLYLADFFFSKWLMETGWY